MLEIFRKELRVFFSSLIGYFVIGVFVLLLGLMLWVFPDFSILEYNSASLDQLFFTAPLIFLFLIPAITMRSFSEELQNGTMELLITKPISYTDIVLGKYFACLVLVIIALFPSLIYYFSIYQLASPIGNVDHGAIIGSYIGLLLLSGAYVSIGLFCSSLTKNQIVAFLIGVVLCFLLFYSFFYFSKLSIFFGKTDDLIQRIGMQHHYESISRGLIDTRDIIYFFSLIFFLSGLAFLTYNQEFYRYAKSNGINSKYIKSIYHIRAFSINKYSGSILLLLYRYYNRQAVSFNKRIQIYY
jgi:ABC-2 type transport system permease protein